MKIAIASDGNRVSGHFGHCEGFNVFQVDEGEILNSEFIPNPGHRPGFLPVFLKEREIDIIIAGGMGGSAQQLFSDNDIEVIVGAQGDCESLIEQYLKGNLQSTGSVCNEHAHEGHCED